MHAAHGPPLEQRRGEVDGRGVVGGLDRPPQGRDERLRLVVAARERGELPRADEPRCEVRALACRPRDEPRQRLVPCAGGAEARLAVLADRLEHPVPRGPRACVLERQQRLVDEVREPAAHVVGPRDGRGERRGERAGDHGETLEQVALVVGQQLTAPVDQRPQARVPLGQPAQRVVEQCEPVREPVQQVLHGHRPQPGGGELERERQVVEPAAQLERALVVPHQAGARVLGARVQQRERGVVGQGSQAVHAFADEPQRRAGRREHRDVGRCDRQQVRDRAGGVREHVLAVVEHDEAAQVVRGRAQPLEPGQHAPLGDVRERRRGLRPAELAEQRGQHVVTRPQTRELDHVDRLAALGGESRDLGREARLAGPARRDDRDHRSRPERGGHGGDVRLAPDERRRRAAPRAGQPDRPALRRVRRRVRRRLARRRCVGHGGRRGRGRAPQLAAQQREVRVLHHRGGVGAVPLGQVAAQRLDHLQRLGVPTLRGQHMHQQGRGGLVGRCAGGEQAQVVVVERPTGTQRGAGRDVGGVREQAHGRRVQRGRRQQGPGRGGVRTRGRGVVGGERGPRGDDERAHLVGVHHEPLARHPVPAGDRLDGHSEPPHARDERLHRPGLVVGRRAVPHGLDQRAHGHRVTARRDELADHGREPLAAHGPAVERERSERGHLHAPSIPHGAWGSAQRPAGMRRARDG